MKQQNHTIKKIARILLGCMLISTGIAHMTFKRKDFRAQVPDGLPGTTDDIVLASGVVEIMLGMALVFAGKKRATIGKVAALFFIAVFPGNIAQYRHKRNAFGLDTDKKRFIRLFFQPFLVWWALKSTSLSGDEKADLMLSEKHALEN